MVNHKKYGKVAVLMGGTAAEREVSLKSGAAVLAALLRQEIDAVGIDFQKQTHFLQQLTEIKPDCIFIALHGRGGEDGVMQGFLETLEIPYTGSGVLASALGMDKRRCKQIWQAAGLPTPASDLLNSASDFASVVERLGLPLMVKPVHEGSSVGMSLVSSATELSAAFELASRYDTQVLVERYIKGKEYTAAILQQQLLPLIRLQTPRKFYDFAAKYSDPSTAYLCPCGLDSEQERQLQFLAKQAFDACGACGWGRVDFMLDQDGQPWLLEINTVPGMTDHSLVPLAAKTAGIAFDHLVLRILDTAWA